MIMMSEFALAQDFYISSFGKARRKVGNYTYNESPFAKFSEEQKMKQRYEFAKQAYDLANNFTSDLIQVYAFSDYLMEEEPKNQLNQDMGRVSMPLLMFIIYISLHTRSCFIGIASTIIMIGGVMISQVIFVSILQVEYWSTIHVFELMILVAFGASNILTYNKFWVKSFEHKHLQKWPIGRLSLAARQSMSVLSNTTLTGMGVFFILVRSTLKPLQSFGWFAIIALLVFYIQTICLMPVVYYLYERNFLKCCYVRAIYKRIYKEDKDFSPEFVDENMVLNLDSINKVAPA
jgi:hypothetical protein